VRRLFIDADAGRARKIVAQPRRRPGPLRFQEPLAEPVEIARRHARLGGVEHPLQDQRDDPADPFQGVDVVLRFDGHARPLRRAPKAVSALVGQLLGGCRDPPP
jgi:hypothetical protein